MPRDIDALKIAKWAANGDVSTPESEGLTRATGWPASYSQAGGDVPTRELFNQLFREITALLVEINTRGGILAWDSSIFYIHPALVMGSNGKPYISVADSTGVDPVTDTSNSSWTLLEDFIAPNASTAVKGKVELATNAETRAGTNATRVVTPAGLTSWWSNLAVGAGKITSGVLSAARIPGLAASKITSGVFPISRLPVPSKTEAEAGTINNKVMTPLRTKEAVAASGGEMRVERFISSGTWNVPAGHRMASVLLIGGGSNGSAGQRAPSKSLRGRGGRGGEGGERVRSGIFKLEGLTSVTITVGAAGGDSHFGNLFSVAGGSLLSYDDFSFWHATVDRAGSGGRGDGRDGSQSNGGNGWPSGAGGSGNSNEVGGNGTSISNGVEGLGAGGGGGAKGRHDNSHINGWRGGAGGVPGGGGGGGGGGDATSATNAPSSGQGFGGTGGAGARGEVTVISW